VWPGVWRQTAAITRNGIRTVDRLRTSIVRELDVALVDAVATTVAKCRIDTERPGFTALMALISEHTDEAKSVAVAIETEKASLWPRCRPPAVDAINPRAVARYRERSARAGKSDPGDAIVLANILRTDLAVHRPLPKSEAPPRRPHTA